MPVVPYYAQAMSELGCCSGTSEGNTSQQLLALQQTVEKQSQQIQALQKALAGKVDKSSLVMVHSLEDKPLFRAIPIEEGDDNGGY